MSRIRVAVADDSAFIRQAVARMLQEEAGVVLAGLAGSGEELLDHLDSWRPDVVILDLSMPGLGGLATLDAIMARRPTPVLILSTHSRQDAPQTIEALHRGALDFIDKQQYSLVDFERLRAVLLEKIQQLARRPAAEAAAASAGAAGAVGAAAVPSGQPLAPALAGAAGGPSPVALAAGALPGAPAATAAVAAAARSVRAVPELLVLGASTGGPPAIEAILRRLAAAPVPVPVVVVQHMPAGFTRSFAERLNAGLPLPVREITDDEPLTPGTVYVAPGGLHLRLVRGRGGLRAALSSTPEASAHRPSIDLLFSSAATVVGSGVVAAVLTGMGYDGAAGVAALAHAGAYVVAQDEASSAVHGMPRAAVATGGVREILPLSRIGDRLCELLAAPAAGAAR